MGVLETTYKTAIEKPLQILEIFNEFFGEDRVDMQGYPSLSEVESALPRDASVADVKLFISNWQSRRGAQWFILVHFPIVKITNENDRSVVIHHLYAKVTFDSLGRMIGRFTLNRSEYSLLHLQNNYMHSHVCDIPLDNPSEFQSPCTGSGPINSTICSLAVDFDEDLWRLFCLELDKYVHVESISGVPYHRLEGLTARNGNLLTIGNGLFDRNKFPTNNTSRLLLFTEFTKHLIDKGHLRFHYTDGQYKVALSPTQAIIKISNLFIDWYNKHFNESELFSSTFNDLVIADILVICKYSNGHLMREVNSNRRSTRDYSVYAGREMFKFKGAPVLFTITDAPESVEDENDVIIIKPEYIEYILTKILNVINFRYGNQGNKETSSRKAVCFL